MCKAELQGPLAFKKLNCMSGCWRTHMQDLQEVTQDLHYENFRSERLKKAGRWDTASVNQYLSMSVRPPVGICFI